MDADERMWMDRIGERERRDEDDWLTGVDVLSLCSGRACCSAEMYRSRYLERRGSDAIGSARESCRSTVLGSRRVERRDPTHAGV